MQSQTRLQTQQIQEQEQQPSCCDQFFLYSHIRTLFINEKFKRNKKYDQFIKQDLIHEYKHLYSIREIVRRVESRGLIILLVLSIVIGLFSIVGPLFQNILTQQILRGTNENAYRYFAIITVFLILRTSLFNYAVTLASNIGVNVKLSLSNALLKTLFNHRGKYISEQIYHRRSYFYEIDIIKQFISLIPYAIVSLILMIGLIVLIIVLIGGLGVIVLGVYVIVIVVQVILAKLASFQYNEKIEKYAKRSNTMSIFTSELLKLSYKKIARLFKNVLVKQRQEQCAHSRNISIFYFSSQFFVDAASVVSLIILFAISKNSNQQELLISQVYLVSLYLAMLYSPLRVFVYGLFIMIQAHLTFHTIEQSLNKYQYNHQSQENIQHCFIENIGSCFNYKLQKPQKLIPGQYEITLQDEPKQPLDLQKNLCIIVLGKINNMSKLREQDSRLRKYMVSKQQNSNFTFAQITEQPFISEGTVKENILFYSSYNQAKYQQILQLTQISQHVVRTGDSFRINERYLRPFRWLSLRIELARALYNDVNMLVIKLPMVYGDSTLLQNIINYRKNKRQHTIIINNGSLCLEEADSIVLFENKKIKQIGKAEELLSNEKSLIHQFNHEMHSTIDKDEQQLQSLTLSKAGHNLAKQSFVPIIDPINEQQFPQISRCKYLSLYNYVHRCASLIIFISLLIPSLLKLYLTLALVTALTSQNIAVQFNRYLVGGIVYLFFVFLKGILLSFYLQKSTQKLVIKLFQKLKSLKIGQILAIHHNSGLVSMETHIERVDRNLSMDFQLWFQSLVDGMLSLVFVLIANVIYLALVLPVIILSFIFRIVFLNKFRTSRVERLHPENQNARFLASNIKNSKNIMGYQRQSIIYDQFIKMSLEQAQTDTKQNMLLSASQKLGELILILALIVATIVFINLQIDNENQIALASMGISFLIGLTDSYRLSLKIYRQVQMQLISVTQLMGIIGQEGQPAEGSTSDLEVVESVDIVEYKDFSVEVGETYCKNINLVVKKGERVCMRGSRFSGKELLIYGLIKVFNDKDIKGQVLVNGKPFHQILLKNFGLMAPQPIYPNTIITVQQCLQINRQQQYTRQEIDRAIDKLWQIAKIQSLFNAQTEISTLSIAEKQLIQFCRFCILGKYKAIMINEGLGNVDTNIRVNLVNYLKENSEIDIVVELTNKQQIMKCYPRNIGFRRGEIVFDNHI